MSHMMSHNYESWLSLQQIIQIFLENGCQKTVMANIKEYVLVIEINPPLIYFNVAIAEIQMVWLEIKLKSSSSKVIVVLYHITGIIFQGSGILVDRITKFVTSSTGATVFSLIVSALVISFLSFLAYRKQFQSFYESSLMSHNLRTRVKIVYS